MDISPSAIWKNWIPSLPEITRTSFFAALGNSANSEHQDAATQIIVAAARPFLQTPASLKKSQDFFKTDWPVIGRTWLSKYTIAAPLDRGSASSALDLRDAVKYAITKLNAPFVKSSEDGCPCTIPEICSVETEWTAYRPNVSPMTPLPRDTQPNLYERMMEDTPSSGATILYLHGGAHCLMDPATHRFTTSNLARESGGRIFSVRYRLSPQHIFPAALIDAFVAWLALVLPPDGAFHEAVPTEKIVLAGDSSGGGIAASLLLLLLTLSKEDVIFRWQGRDISIPSPPCAGLAVASPWLDVSRCLPSCTENARWDIIAPPPFLKKQKGSDSSVLGWGSPTPAFPEDDIWPAEPPRAETYCAANVVAHPLVSPLAAPKECWRGSPDVWVGVGWEGMQDEAEVFARRVHEGGARVVFDGFEGMPHCFGVVPWCWAGRRAMGNWGTFCKDVVRAESEGVSHQKKKSVATWTRSKTGEVREVRVEELGMTQVGCGYERKIPLDDAEVDRRIEEGWRWRVELEEQMVRDWKQEKQKEKISAFS